MHFPRTFLMVIAINFLGLLTFVPQTFAQVQSHPFLLVNQGQYTQLRSLSSQEPWSGMKTRAIAECTQRTFPPSFPGTCNGNLSTINGDYPSLGSDAYCMRAIVSSCALASIIDTPNRTTYINKIVATMPHWEDILIAQSGANDGTPAWSTQYLTDATAAYFNTMLAIDIVHDDLAAQSMNLTYPGVATFTNQLQYAEFLMEQEFNHFWGSNKPVYNLVLKNGSTLAYSAAPSNYPPAREAALILWKIYDGTFLASDSDSQVLLNGNGMIDNGAPAFPGTNPPSNVLGYLPEMAARINSSGTYSEGPGYAYAGWGLDRDERSHLIDILEFTGKDQEFGVDFYTNPKFVAFYEWLYGYASTPFGLMTSFSDTHALRLLRDIGHGGNNWTTSSHIGQAGRFGATAGSYAAWKNNNDPQQGRLLNYLLFSPVTSNARPQSRIFTNGGAYFLSEPVNDQSLYGALYNVKQPEAGQPVFHVRKDANALYLAAYGAPLLMNGGFCGASSPAGPDGCSGVDENNVRTYFEGAYLGDRAVSNNTAMANYTVGANDLNPNPDTVTTNFGGGISEGFTSQDLDYASGDGDAFFPNGDHKRNFLMIHPSSQNQGYFIVFDEFSNVTQGPINLAFHPNATSRQTVTNLTEYDTTVFRRFQAVAGTGLALFFGTPPSAIEFHRGIIASSSGGAITPEYFFNTYPISGTSKNIVTVLFPHDPTHPKPTMSRISDVNFTGASVNHGNNIIDYVIESSSVNQIQHQSNTFTGSALFYRQQNGNLSQYFVRKARNFSASNRGFSANQPVSLYLNDRTGNLVTTTTTQLTLTHPGITGVRLNNQLLTPISQTSQSITVSISTGTHTLELVTTNTPSPTPGTSPSPTHCLPLGDIDCSGKINSLDFGSIFKYWGTSTYIANLNDSGLIDGADARLLLSSFGQ